MPSTILPSFRDLSDGDLAALLKENMIGLSPEEARGAQEMLGRPLTLTEAVMWGIQGSEHCSYKSSRRFLKTLPTENRHVILGPKEDAGIVAITDGPKGKRWGLVIGHESHNKPSQIVPYEGAATGIGGCVRDVVCMGARVIGAMDALRLGDLSTSESKSIAKEVVRGIAGYGNPLGIPNLGGDTVFDATYNENCLVNAVCVGIVREDQIIHSHVPASAGKEKYDIILIGKATDRSGFGGAAFASVTLEEEKREQNTGAVQEPNPFLERHLLAATYDLFDILTRDGNLGRVSFKDLGAGGIMGATVEQVADVGLGATVRLDDVHVAIADLPPQVIACAETQERLCWICHPDLTEMIVAHYNVAWDLPSVAENARASVIGTVTENPQFLLTYRGDAVCDAPATAITSGFQYTRPTAEKKNECREPEITCTDDTISVLGKTFTIARVVEALLAHPSHGSKAAAYKHYDKSVMGNTLVEAGEADASVIAPLTDLASYVHGVERKEWTITKDEEHAGVALSVGGNGRYGRISPYWQGVNAVTEVMRNVSAVGAVPRALTDCLNYRNPEIPQELWELEEAVRGIADTARGVAFGGEPVALVSGNVSLYNRKIDPTAIVACVGVMPDARKAVTMRLKHTGDSLYLLGVPKDECGGSAYYDVLERLTGCERNALLGANVPSPDFASVLAECSFLHRVIQGGLVAAAHDVSEGGLMLALIEMTLPQRKIGGDVGMRIDLSSVAPSLRNDAVLFAETGSVILEVSREHETELVKIAEKSDVVLTRIGETTTERRISVSRGKELFASDLAPLHAAHGSALARAWDS